MRTRIEETSAPLDWTETPLTRNMLRLRQLGKISEETLFIYGISGDLPKIAKNAEESARIKEIFRERLRRRFGVRWKNLFVQRIDWLYSDDVKAIETWLKEGF
jgi:hypothetical protein